MSRLHRSCCTSLASVYQADDLAAELWCVHGFSLHSDVHDHRQVMSSKIKWACTDITVGLASLGLESFSLETLSTSQRICESSRLIFSGEKCRAALFRHFGTILIWWDTDPKHHNKGQEKRYIRYLAWFQWHIWNAANKLMLAVSIKNVNQ